MVIGTLLIILTIINILLLVLDVILLATSLYYYFLMILFVIMVLYLVISTIFFKYTNKQLDKEKEILRSFKLTRCIYKENEVRYIDFVLKDNKWVSKQDETLVFALDDYLFKKSFIIARIIRELRYPIVSNLLKLSKLLNFNLKIDNIDTLIVRFINGKKIIKYTIVKKQISKNTILSRAISKSKYYNLYFSNRSYNKYMKRIEKINEDLYLN